MTNTIDEINQFVNEQLWLDMTVQSYDYELYSPSRLTIIGSLDRFEPHIIEIGFENVFFISLPVEWTTVPEVRTISLLKAEEARPINIRFQVEIGHHLFRLGAEDYSGNLAGYVSAKKLWCNILRDPHDP